VSTLQSPGEQGPCLVACGTDTARLTIGLLAMPCVNTWCASGECDVPTELCLHRHNVHVGMSVIVLCAVQTPSLATPPCVCLPFTFMLSTSWGLVLHVFNLTS
jgi:hypothetical protein